MSKEPEKAELAPIEAQALNPFVLAIDKSLEPLDYAQIAQAMGLSGPRIPAEGLVDTTFIITGAKAYQSAFDETKHVYFCICKDVKTGEIFTTSLGGSAVVDVLDSLSAAGIHNPLKVTLRHNEGGRFGGYYTFE